LPSDTARRDPRRAVRVSLRPLALLRRIETRALLLLLGAAIGVWGFFEVGGEVAEGEADAFDRRILLSLRNVADPNDPIGPRTFEEAMRDVTALGGFTVLTIVTVVAAVAFLIHGRRRHAIVLVGAVLLAQASSEIAKAIYGRPRPDLVSHGSYVYSGSFPSGHSMLSAATYLTLAMLIASVEPTRGAKRLCFGLAVLVTLATGFSRVYLGVHWPSDVLGGWCLGAAWSLAAWFVLLRLGSRPTHPRG
jgi:undecaprenyl-diphosphatase